MKQVWKRRAVVAAVLVLVGTSVYLNWRYAGDVSDPRSWGSPHW